MINSWNNSEPPGGLIQHIKRWNKWRKNSLNGRFYKMLVLLGVIKSPTFILTYTDEENAYYMEWCYALEDRKEFDNRVRIMHHDQTV